MAGWPIPNVWVRVVDLDMNDVPRDMQTIGEVVAARRSHHGGLLQRTRSHPRRHERRLVPHRRHGRLGRGRLHPHRRPQEGDHHQRRREYLVHRGGEGHLRAPRRVSSAPWWRLPTRSGERCRRRSLFASPVADSTAISCSQFLSDRLGRFKIPRVVEFTEEPLPKTGTGKIRKMIIRERFWAGQARRVQGG